MKATARNAKQIIFFKNKSFDATTVNLTYIDQAIPIPLGIPIFTNEVSLINILNPDILPVSTKL